MRQFGILCCLSLLVTMRLASQNATLDIVPQFPGFDTAVLATYAADPDYQYTQSTPEESLLDRWWKAFKNMLRDLFFEGRNTGRAILYIILIGGAAILLIYFLSNSRFQGAFTGRDHTMDSGRILETDLPETPLDILAARAFEAGDFRLAFRWGYLDLLRKLSDQRHLRLHAEKTNRDYKYEMGKHPQSQSFVMLANTFDRIWYGGYPMDASAYAECQLLMDMVVAENPSV